MQEAAVAVLGEMVTEVDILPGRDEAVRAVVQSEWGRGRDAGRWADRLAGWGGECGRWAGREAPTGSILRDGPWRKRGLQRLRLA